MSNAKTTQARAAKRNARAKSKQTSAAKARANPANVQKRKIQAVMKKHGLGRMDFDDVLNNAVRDVNKGKKVETTITTPEEMIQGMKDAGQEVFKLYSYITFAEALNEKGIISYKPALDLKEISVNLMNMDNQISRLQSMLGVQEEEVVMTEALDIGTSLQNYAEELYAEVKLLEPLGIEIEAALEKLASEEKDLDIDKARIAVLSAFAYKKLVAVKAEVDAAKPVVDAPAEPSSETVA